MMMEFLLKTLQRLLSYYPVIVPTFFILYRESAISVKTWQAVQRISSFKPTEKDGENESPPYQGGKPRNPLKFVLGFLMTAIYVGIVVMVPVFSELAVAKLRTFYICMLSAPFVFLVGIVASTQSCDADVVRSVEGKPFISPSVAEDCSPLKRGLSFAFGVLVTVGALWFGHPLAALVVYAALIHAVVRSKYVPTGKASFRELFYTAIFANVFLALIVNVLVKTSDNKAAETSDHPSGDEDIIIINWTQLFMSANPTGFPFLFEFLSLAYRFDYSNSLPLDLKPAVSKNGNIGFRIPRPTCFAIRETFPRPYFITAFVALFLSYVGVAVLCESFSINVSYESTSIFTMLLYPGIIPSSMILVATMKGQLGKLWKYEEDWAAIPSISEGLEVSDIDIALQKYEGDGKDVKDLVNGLDYDGKVEFQGEHFV